MTGYAVASIPAIVPMKGEQTMQHIPPYPMIDGDSDDRIMARMLTVVGFSKARVVWRAGFLPGSPHANAYGVDTGSRGFLFLLTTNSGRILSEFWGSARELPTRFRTVIDARI